MIPFMFFCMCVYGYLCGWLLSNIFLKTDSCLEKLSGRFLKVGRALSANMSCQALIDSQFGAGLGASCWGRPPDNMYRHSAYTQQEHLYINGSHPDISPQDLSLLCYYFFIITNIGNDMTTQC